MTAPQIKTTAANFQCQGIFRTRSVAQYRFNNQPWIEIRTTNNPYKRQPQCFSVLYWKPSTTGEPEEEGNELQDNSNNNKQKIPRRACPSPMHWQDLGPGQHYNFDVKLIRKKYRKLRQTLEEKLFCIGPVWESRRLKQWRPF